MDKREPNENMNNNTYILAEYKVLRDEINHLNGLASSALHVSVLASLATIGYLFQLKSLNLLLFPIPFLIILPSLFIIISRFQAVMRVSGYIRVFLEKVGGLSYENRYLKWMSKVSTSGKRIGFSFRETIFYLHLGLGLLSIGVFISKGLVPNLGCWKSVAGYISVYILPFPFYFYAYQLIKQDWRKVYDEYWRKVKEDEENGTAYNSG